MKSWTFLKHVIVSILITVTLYLGSLIMSIVPTLQIIGFRNIFGNKQAASVAIIGGADGPTAVFYRFNGIYSFIFNRYIIIFIVLLIFYFPLKALYNRYIKDGRN